MTAGSAAIRAEAVLPEYSESAVITLRYLPHGDHGGQPQAKEFEVKKQVKPATAITLLIVTIAISCEQMYKKWIVSF
jgi:hypothetical protein